MLRPVSSWYTTPGGYGPARGVSIMLFKSALVTAASGSLGGLVASHNRGGAYLRARTIPVNPGSVFQQTVRDAVISLAAKWGELLTVAQRTAWEVYADAVPIPNALGDPRVLTGLAMYVRSNVPRIQVGYPRVDDAPTIFNLGDVTGPGYDGLTPPLAVTISFDPLDDWANEDDSGMLVYISPPKMQSINYYKGPYRLAGTIDGITTPAPPTTPAAITSPFTYSALNPQRSFAQIRVSRADGRLSGPFRPQISIP